MNGAKYYTWIYTIPRIICFTRALVSFVDVWDRQIWPLPFKVTSLAREQYYKPREQPRKALMKIICMVIVNRPARNKAKQIKINPWACLLSFLGMFLSEKTWNHILTHFDKKNFAALADICYISKTRKSWALQWRQISLLTTITRIFSPYHSLSLNHPRASYVMKLACVLVYVTFYVMPGTFQ